jgi:hypothetical protein
MKSAIEKRALPEFNRPVALGVSGRPEIRTVAVFMPRSVCRKQRRLDEGRRDGRGSIRFEVAIGLIVFVALWREELKAFAAIDLGQQTERNRS